MRCSYSKGSSSIPLDCLKSKWTYSIALTQKDWIGTRSEVKDSIIINIERKGLCDETIERRVECDNGKIKCIAGEGCKCTAKRVSDHVRTRMGIYTSNYPRLLISAEVKGYEQRLENNMTEGR